MTDKIKNGYKTIFLLFFDDLINMKNLDPDKVKTDEKLYKNILKSYIKILSLTTLDLWWSKTLAMHKLTV